MAVGAATLTCRDGMTFEDNEATFDIVCKGPESMQIHELGPGEKKIKKSYKIPGCLFGNHFNIIINKCSIQVSDNENM